MFPGMIVRIPGQADPGRLPSTVNRFRRMVNYILIQIVARVDREEAEKYRPPRFTVHFFGDQPCSLYLSMMAWRRL
jgi:hypothetical protein